MRKANGDLHFFINGRDQGRAASNAPHIIFGVVDLYGMAVKVTILEWIPPAAHAMASFIDHRVPRLSYLRSLAQQELPNVFEGKEDSSSIVCMNWFTNFKELFK